MDDYGVDYIHGFDYSQYLACQACPQQCADHPNIDQCPSFAPVQQAVQLPVWEDLSGSSGP